MQPSEHQVDGSTCLINRQALQQLEQERDRLAAGYGISSSAMVGGAIFSNPLVAAGGVVASGVILKRSEKVSRIIRIMGALLDAFEAQGVEIFQRLEAPGLNPIDLFVRLPEKIFLLISIRSMGDAKLVYNEKTELLYCRRKKGIKQWKPDLLEELSDQELWLRKNRRDLFGGSSKDSRRPLAKLLVISGQTRIEDHSEALYKKMGEDQFLTIRKRGTTTVIQENRLIDFAEAYVAHCRAEKA